jgi:hypothetical protein
VFRSSLVRELTELDAASAAEQLRLGQHILEPSKTQRKVGAL